MECKKMRYLYNVKFLKHLLIIDTCAFDVAFCWIFELK